MIRALHSLACHIYGVAAIIYLAHLVRQWKPLPILGRIVLAGGLVLHGIGLGAELIGQGGMPVGIAQGCSSLALLLVGIFLFLDVRYRLPVLGAFLVPLALAVMVPGLLLSNELTTLSPSLRQPLLPVHITVALLGLAAFAVAAGVALVYLLLERQLKGKRFGLLFSRLPSLQLLDDLNKSLVVWGFVALSVTLVTGAFFVSSGQGLFWQWEPKEVATLVSWALSGLLLNGRAFAGWQGKRAALLTMAGFGVLIVSFVSSFETGTGIGGLR